MRKVLLIVFFLITSVFGSVNLNDGKDAHKLIIAGMYEKLNLFDKQTLGEWFLYHHNFDKWEKVQSNEFKAHKAYDEAYQKLKNLAKKYHDEIMNDEGTIRIRVFVKKYNFDGEYFPLAGLKPNESFDFDDAYQTHFVLLRLSLDNIDVNDNRLQIPPKEAETFLEEIHDPLDFTEGRKIVMKYYFTIKKIEVDTESIKKNIVNDHDRGKIVGHVYKIEYINPANNEVIATVDKK